MKNKAETSFIKSHLSLVSPVCSTNQKLRYGVIQGEPTEVSCTVEAHPVVRNFRWAITNSSRVIKSYKPYNDTTSTIILPYSKENKNILCWGTNAIGTQEEPCSFNILNAGKTNVNIFTICKSTKVR